MPDNSTIYLSRRITSEDVLAVAGANIVPGVGEVLATVRLGQVLVRLSDMPASTMPQHLKGLAGYVQARLPAHSPSLFDRIFKVKQVVGIVIEPGFDGGGEVRAFIAKLAARGDGFIFRNPDLIEPTGAILAGLAKGPGEPRAPEGGEDEDEDEETPPPSPDRVLRRTWALASVAWRGLVETSDNPEERARSVARVQTWVAEIGLADELELEEARVIALPVGELRGQKLANAIWRSEGVAMLAWALGVADLEDHETLCVPLDVFRAVGFMRPRPTAVDPPVLRSPDEIDWQARRATGLHWRLRDFGLNGTATNFRALAGGKIWFGGFDLAGIALVDDDLAIGGSPIARANSDLVRQCVSIAMERHHAINWLEGDARLYSDVDTST